MTCFLGTLGALLLASGPITDPFPVELEAVAVAAPAYGCVEVDIGNVLRFYPP